MVARLPLNADTGSMHLEIMRTGLRIVSHILMIFEWILQVLEMHERVLS